MSIDSLFHDIYITWKRFALNGSRPKSSMVRCVVPLFRGFNLLGLLWYDTVLGLSSVWVFHNLVVHCSTWVFYLTRLLWNITTFMIRCFIPLFRGNYPIMDALIWEGIGLIPSVVLSQNGGPLFYVGVYPDRIALKYHYFYVCFQGGFSCDLSFHYSMGSAKVTHFCTTTCLIISSLEFY